MEIVGAARIVGAGEGTHGTREFFDLEHRLLRALVKRQTVSAFAIEASFPDAMELDRYVRDGAGDPAVALDRLHFWTWRTQEVLDLVRWLRQFNATQPAERRIGFYGVDMQHPGAAVRRVSDWMPASMPSLHTAVVESYATLTPFVNDDAGTFTRDLATEPQATRDRCLAAARAALDALVANAAALRTATTADAYELHLRMATTVVQWATRAAVNSLQYRDFAMAENARWLLRRVPGKVFLWAHNAHVSKASGTMGRSLGDSLGGQYVNVGFLFDSGSFNARPSPTDPPVPLTIGPALDDTYESFFRRFGQTFYFDVRAADSYATRLFMSVPKGMREIGAVFFPDAPSTFVRKASLSDEFDLMFFVPRSTPTRVYSP